MKMKIAAPAIAALALCGAASAATVANSGNFDIEVLYSSEDLTSPAAAEKALDRIENEVEKACAKENNNFRIRTTFVDEYCVEPAVAEAVAKIDNDHLTKAFNDRQS